MVNSRTFFRKLDGIPDIPTLPVVVFKLNTMLHDYDISIHKLSKSMEKDQAVVSKILGLINSAFYGFRSEVKNVPRAVSMLGFNAVRNVILSLSVIKAFSQKETFKGFDITDFWRHSVAVAVTGKYLAERTQIEHPDDCFMAGLLHDIGKVILAQYFKEIFSEVWACVQEDGLSFYEVEKKLSPVNHAQIGGYLGRKWHFPAWLVDAIRFHHRVTTRVSHFDLLIITHVADIIVNAFKVDSGNDPDFSNVCEEATEIVKSQVYTASHWFPLVAEDIECACEFFLTETDGY